MTHLFVSHPDHEQLTGIMNLYQQFDTIAAEQFPGFIQAYAQTEVCHYIQYDSDNKISAYAEISIRKFRIASVSFGPIATTADHYRDALVHVRQYCKKRWIPILRVMPPYFVSQYSDVYLDELKKILGFETSDKEINWSTVLIDITPPLDEVVKAFSDNHKRSIKKAAKMELRVEMVQDHSQIEIFSTQHSDMYEKRGLTIDREKNKQRYTSLFDFFKKTGKGVFLMVFEKETPIGGICCVVQGNAMRYLEGYSHPDYRQYPVTHIAFYEAIKIARDQGLSFFDLGGYANNIEEGDQLSAINRFKDGFKGTLVNYPKTMVMYNLPMVKWLYAIKQGNKKG